MPYCQALWLLIEIELEVGSSDSLLRALNHLQTYCSYYQALADKVFAESEAGSQAVWYKPRTWLRGWIQEVDTEVSLALACASCLRPLQACSMLWKPVYASAPVLAQA